MTTSRTEQTAVPTLDRAISYASSTEMVLAISVFVLQGFILVCYLALTGLELVSIRQSIYPLVWISIAVWLVVSMRRLNPIDSFNRGPFLAATGYVALLAVLGGVIGRSQYHAGATVMFETPGWGPALLYSGQHLQVALFPYEVIGYLALGYGVYHALSVLTTGVLAGGIGLLGCVGCTYPLIVALAGFTGASTTSVHPGSVTYDLATGIILLTAVLLVWSVTRGSTCSR